MVPRIEREGVPGDLRFKLPCRDLGKLKNLGWIPLAGCIFLFLMAVGWGDDLARELWEDLPRNWREIEVADCLPALFLIPSLIMIFLGLKLLKTGAVILGNRTWTEVRVTHTHLRVKEHFGAWTKKRKFPVQSITGLSMAEGFGDKKDDTEVPDKFSAMIPEDLWSLLVFQGEENENLLCVGYPQRVINELSQHLAAQLPGVSNVEIYEEDEEEEAEEGRVGDPKPVKLPREPSGTKVIREVLPDGVAFQVPKMGLGKGSHGMFSFGCIFSCFPLVASGFMIFGNGVEKDLSLLFPILILSVFFLVGGGLMFAGLSTGTRKVIIAATRGGLRIESTSIFGEKDCEWRVGEIKPLKVSPTGTTVGNTALTALYVETQEGKTTAWLKMLGREEQEWIAAHLQKALDA